MTLARVDLLATGGVITLLLALALLAQDRRLERLRAALGRGAARLLPLTPTRSAIRLACTLVAASALSVAAAGPVTRVTAEPEPLAPLDLVVAVDVSLSMTASDVAATRLDRARAAILEITDALPTARVGLVVFAEWPYTLVPLTEDHALIRWFARSLQAEAVPDRHQGTALAAALAETVRALDARAREGARTAIVVLSDGGAHDAEAALAAAEGAATANHEVWVGGLGTARGSVLGSDARPVVDARGAPVVAAIDDGLLRAVAAAGGGRYDDVSAPGRAAMLASAVGGVVAETPAPAPDAARWLALLALPLLLWDGALDRGRGVPRAGAARRAPRGGA